MKKITALSKNIFVLSYPKEEGIIDVPSPYTVWIPQQFYDVIVDHCKLAKNSFDRLEIPEGDGQLEIHPIRGSEYGILNGEGKVDFFESQRKLFKTIQGATGNPMILIVCNEEAKEILEYVFLDEKHNKYENQFPLTGEYQKVLITIKGIHKTRQLCPIMFYPKEVTEVTL